MISAWSHSRLSIFESCKYRAFLAYIKKVPEPDRGDPMVKIGKPEWPNDRGSRIHDQAELYVRGKTDTIIKELRTFQPHLDALRDLFQQGKVVMEDMWCFDNNWKAVGPRAFDKIWGRVKLDVCVMRSPTKATVIDYKTGKRYGNEVKHAEQGQLYQLETFNRYKKLEEVIVELWYTDIDELVPMKFKRNQGMRFMRNFNDRAIAMTTCTEFPKNPNMHTCKWCPYGPAGTNHCPEGVQ